MDPQVAKVLAVEDDVFLKELLSGRLSGSDFNILHASSGEEALELAKAEKPNVILLDIILPGQSGFEVLEQLKADPETASIPVIFLSNLGSEDDVKRGKELGAVDFLVKANNSLDAIVDRVRQEVGQQVEADSNSDSVDEELEQDLTPDPEAVQAAEQASSTPQAQPGGSGATQEPQAPTDEKPPQI